MPTISAFYGLSIRMYWNDHSPPHFHVTHGSQRAAIRIDTLEIISGTLTRRARGLTLEWASLHRSELLENWDLCKKSLLPKRIPPLE
jgi:hypothetical protein